MAELLVVEDDPDIAETLRQVLEGAGHVVRLARHGAEGLALMATALPDAVVLDVEMPVLDGPGMAARMLLENCGRERVPVALFSATADLVEVARKVGTPYYLAKPCHLDQLVGLLAKVLTERRSLAPEGRVQP